MPARACMQTEEVEEACFAPTGSLVSFARPVDQMVQIRFRSDQIDTVLARLTEIKTAQTDMDTRMDTNM